METTVFTEFDEVQIFNEYKKTKDKKLRDKIVAHYMYVAEILSKRFANRGIDYEDIFQVACLGLVLAVDRFDAQRGVKFTTFATPTVVGEIKKYFRDKGCFIKIPRKMYEIFTKAEKLCQGMDREDCTPEQIAKHLNLSVELIRKAYSAGDMAFIQSLEQQAYTDSSSLYYDTLGSDDKNFIMIENADFLNSCKAELSEKEQAFIDLRFYEELTQKQISGMWNMSQMQVSRFEKALLKKLKNIYYR